MKVIPNKFQNLIVYVNHLTSQYFKKDLSNIFFLQSPNLYNIHLYHLQIFPPRERSVNILSLFSASIPVGVLSCNFRHAVKIIWYFFQNMLTKNDPLLSFIAPNVGSLSPNLMHLLLTYLSIEINLSI